MDKDKRSEEEELRLSRTIKQFKDRSAFWEFFTSPPINSAELFILLKIYESYQTRGIKFSYEDLSWIIDNALLFTEEIDHNIGNSNVSLVNRFIHRLEDHRFIIYNTSTKEYSLRKPALILGKALIELKDTQFLYYDEKYLQEIVINILVILEDWKDKSVDINNTNLQSIDQRIYVNEILERMLRKDQELKRFNELEVQIIDLNHQSLKIMEEIKKVVIKLQVKLIEALHLKGNFKIVKKGIENEILNFKSQIERLNQKYRDINHLISKNEVAIDKIIEAIDVLEGYFESIEQRLTQHQLSKDEATNRIRKNLKELSSLCESLSLFTSQLKITKINVIFERIGIIELLFRYLQDLMQNTQLQGDLYSIWKIGIHDNLLDVLSQFPNESHSFPPILVNPKIKDIHFGNITIDILEKRSDESLEEKIKERNLEEKKRHDQEKKRAEEELELLKLQNMLIDEIIQVSINTRDPIDLAKIVYELSRSTRFCSINYYPNLLASVWNKLIAEYKIIAHIEEKSEKREGYVYHKFQFEENELIHLKNMLITIGSKNES